MKTYFIYWSSWFDSHNYDSGKMIKAVLKADGKNPILASQYGWDNMPDVVVFETNPENLDNIQKELENFLGTEWIIINEVEWKIQKKVKAF